MKKIYETPSVEKIKFNYRDQVVVASGADDNDKPTSEWSGGYICGNDWVDKVVEGAIDLNICSWG